MKKPRGSGYVPGDVGESKRRCVIERLRKPCVSVERRDVYVRVRRGEVGDRGCECRIKARDTCVRLCGTRSSKVRRRTIFWGDVEEYIRSAQTGGVG
jgi:hypothetical protein